MLSKLFAVTVSIFAINIYGLSRSSNRLLRHGLRMSTLEKPVLKDYMSYSGSSGAAIELRDVCISVGNNDIINDVQWTILPNERWGLVGRNGAGKSTLLRTITCSGDENVAVRVGSICIAKKARMGYLEQKGSFESRKNSSRSSRRKVRLRHKF